MKAQATRELTEKERLEKMGDLSQEYFNLKFQLATGKIENPSRLRDLRRDIARLKTIQRENPVSDENSLKHVEENKASSDK